MALQKNIKIVDNFGIEVEIPNAYIKIHDLNCTKDVIRFNVLINKEKDKLNLSTQVYSCNYDIDGENPIKQGYLYLKTLPEFTDAVDC
jgi:hypothetical protein